MIFISAELNTKISNEIDMVISHCFEDHHLSNHSIKFFIAGKVLNFK